VLGTSFSAGGSANFEGAFMSIMLAAAGTMAAATFRALLTYGEEVAGATLTGYSARRSMGSLTPHYFKGQKVDDVYSSTSDLFIVRILGHHPQSFFSSIKCSLGTFQTSAASSYFQDTYPDSVQYTHWQWSHATELPSSGSETIQINP
jgi:hypothetical protein